MCGITGLIDTQGKSNKGILSKMTDTLLHRGPDSGSLVFYTVRNAQIGLGHRRLSIIDLSERGTQPMAFQQYWICFNGEIYNYQEIKNELLVLGHIFLTSTDTEVILHSYQEWGKDCVHKFRGMFAIVIIDNQKEEVFCVRDRVGVKPFFFFIKEGVFLFSSELKALHQHPKFEKKINVVAVEQFMQFGNIPAPYTIFENTHKLRPGYFMRFTFSELEKKSDSFKQIQYWNVYDYFNRPKIDLPFNEALEKTEKILTDSFQLRMVSDMPVGIFLSGGVDSAAVASILQKNQTQRIKTFTISVPDDRLNEAHFAKKIAAILGTEHTEFTCTQAEALKMFEELPYYFDEPFGDSSALPTSLVAKIAKQKVTVALSADGGDELFAGYNHYQHIIRYFKTLGRLHPTLRKSMVEMMQNINPQHIPYFKNTYNFANRYEKLKRILQESSINRIMWGRFTQFTEEEISCLLCERKKLPFTAYDNKELKKDYFSILSYMLAFDFQTYLPDDIMTKVDRSTMRFGLEGREPFLDHKNIEWIAQLPDKFKYNKGIKKYILKEIVYKYIPKELLDRPKMGFTIPIEKWMQNDLRQYIETFLSTEQIKKQGVFNPLEVERIKMNFFNGKVEYSNKIWYLLMFQMWWERWMK